MLSRSVRTRCVAAGVGLVLMLVSGPMPAQVEKQAPTTGTNTSIYRAETSLVLVDAMVTDKHNRSVLNLSPRDFAVYEDDVPQTIESVRMVSLRSRQSSDRPEVSPGPGIAKRTAPESRREGILAEEQQYMVLLLDYASTELENQIFVRAAAERYFRKHMSSGLAVAVVRVGLGIQLLQDFTDHPDAIVAALERKDASGSNYRADRQYVQGLIGGARSDQDGLQASLNALTSGPNSSDPRAGQRSSYISAMLSSEVRQEKLAFATQAFANLQQSRPILDAIHAIADSVAPLPGRKSLVLISRGFSIPEPLLGPLYAATQAASRARMAIYAVDSGGLQYKPVSPEGELHRDIGALQVGERIGDQFGETQFDRARQVGSDQEDGTLRYLSAATGGLFIHNTNDFFEAFGRIEADSHTSYLLSYRPRKLVLDGKFRQIRVAVSRPGLDVRARSGYFAMPSGASNLSPIEYRQMFAAAQSSPTTELPVYAEPLSLLEKDGTYLVELPVEIPLPAVARESKPEILGVVRDSNGLVIDSFRSPDLGADSAAAPSFTAHLHLGPGTYSLGLLALDAITHKRGYRDVSLKLEPATSGLTVSNLVLSQHVETAARGENTPWTVGNAHIFPCAVRRFHNQQNLIFYFNVYRPQVRPENGRPDVLVTLTLAREGRPINVILPSYILSEIELTPVRHVQVARYLRLEGLPAGPYLLRAKVEDRIGGRSVSTQAAFELEQ